MASKNDGDTRWWSVGVDGTVVSHSLQDSWKRDICWCQKEQLSAICKGCDETIWIGSADGSIACLALDKKVDESSDATTTTTTQVSGYEKVDENPASAVAISVSKPRVDVDPPDKKDLQDEEIKQVIILKRQIATSDKPEVQHQLKCLAAVPGRDCVIKTRILADGLRAVSELKSGLFKEERLTTMGELPIKGDPGSTLNDIITYINVGIKDVVPSWCNLTTSCGVADMELSYPTLFHSLFPGKAIGIRQKSASLFSIGEVLLDSLFPTVRQKHRVDITPGTLVFQCNRFRIGENTIKSVVCHDVTSERTPFVCLILIRFLLDLLCVRNPYEICVLTGTD